MRQLCSLRLVRKELLDPFRAVSLTKLSSHPCWHGPKPSFPGWQVSNGRQDLIGLMTSGKAP
jgi:hypothetical protein